MAALAPALAEALLGLIAIAIGQWGRTRAADLIPAGRDAEEREHLATVYHRGATASVVVGFLLIVVGFAGAVDALT